MNYLVVVAHPDDEILGAGATIHKLIEEGVVHYCVGNMPGAVPYTSTLALTNATLRYGLMIADNGVEEAIKNTSIRNGLNIYDGKVTNKNLADALGYEYFDY